MAGVGPVHLRGAVEMLLWFYSAICAMIRTMKPTVCCNRNLQFPLHFQVCQVPPDLINVRVQAELCSRSSNLLHSVFLPRNVAEPPTFVSDKWLYFLDST